jgi:hypothetical protein
MTKLADRVQTVTGKCWVVADGDNGGKELPALSGRRRCTAPRSAARRPRRSAGERAGRAKEAAQEERRAARESYGPGPSDEAIDRLSLRPLCGYCDRHFRARRKDASFRSPKCRRANWRYSKTCTMPPPHYRLTDGRSMEYRDRVRRSGAPRRG